MKLTPLICGFLIGASALATAAEKKIVLIAGRPSHPAGMHEFRAGMLLLQKCLSGTKGVTTVVHSNGWPKDAEAFAGADAVVIYADGGGGHPAIQGDHKKILGDLAKKGVGLGFMHYGVEVPATNGGPEFLEWIGGHYEHLYSVNPMWSPEYKTFPKHPVANGVKPFSNRDEWYFNMRFREGKQGLIPILTATPSDEVRKGPYVYPKGPYEHIVQASGREETMMWIHNRPDGGRGFGFTGGHTHANWGNENQRKVVLNALLWLAGAEVPANGVESTVTPEDLQQNLDPKGAQRRAEAAPASGVSAANAKFKSGIVSGSKVVPVEADITGAKELWLVVTDGGDGFGCDWSNWIDPQLVKADGSVVKLTDLKWESATSSHGRAGVNKNSGGQPMKVAGKSVSGIGTHASSQIQYVLPAGTFTRFKASAALDDGGTSQGCGSTVEFMVFTAKPALAAVASTPRSGGAASGGAAHNRPASREAALEDLKKMTVAEGLEVTLFASEPMMVNPCDMDIDARGRVWITEGANYRKWANPPVRPEGDRILIMEDTDGDGAADKSTVFYQGPEINSALGICVLGNKVIVSCSPNVFVFTDENGDDKADKKEVLFSGISGVQHDHGMHAFVFGPDGKLYFNFGNDGRQIKDKDGKPIIDTEGNEVNAKGKPYRQGMVFRSNPDGSEFEVLGHNFRNNYEVTVDSFGTLWQSDNDDDGNKGVRINYVMERGNFGYTEELKGAGWPTGWKTAQGKGAAETEKVQYQWHQYDPGVVPNLLNTGAGSPTGITVYEGTLLPAVFRNQILHCDAGPSVVRAYPVTPQGAGYSATITNLLRSSDPWFRPSDVCVAPDGSVLVADWNDPGVGGHAAGDHDLKIMRGRVYRVAPPGAKYTVPKLDVKTAEGAVAALKSPNNATRYLAWTALHQMQAAAERPLQSLLGSKSDPRERARALQLLARIPGKEKTYVEAALQDGNADVRITGLRTARLLKLDVIPAVSQLAKDASAQVRRECAIALRHSAAPAAPKLWAQLAAQHDGKDRWYLEALGIGADRQQDAYFAAWLELVKGDWNTQAGRDIVWRSRSTKSVPMLVKLITAKETSASDKGRYLRALDFISGPEKEAALVEIATGAL